MSSSIQTAYLYKCDFEKEGILPYLQPAGSTEESCSICLSTIASCLPPPTTAAEKQQQKLTKEEEEFLATFDPEVHTSASILTLTKRTFPALPLSHHHHHHNDNNKKEEERAEPGAKLAPCGHVFGSKCIEKWLSEHTTCPMCRKVLFPCQPAEEEEYWAWVEAEMEARAARIRRQMLEAYWY